MSRPARGRWWRPTAARRLSTAARTEAAEKEMGGINNKLQKMVVVVLVAEETETEKGGVDDEL